MSELIDFKLLPVDTLVDCDFFGDIHTILFKGVSECGQYYTASSTPKDVTNGRYFTEILAEKIRISDKNDWVAWFGLRECPVPHNCTVEYYKDDREGGDWHGGNGYAKYAPWAMITKYRLLESPWQTVDSVID